MPSWSLIGGIEQPPARMHPCVADCGSGATRHRYAVGKRPRLPFSANVL
jgi:hypothetical protein